jgi:hypothetical protein
MGIGPSSKETTLHHYRDPLVERLSGDSELDFLGIVLEGTPEVCDHKQFVADRAGTIAELARADGVIVSIDSWGNSHVDFTSVIQAVGERGIPVVGMSFVGNQASFVVTNRYMDTIIDFNKTSSGIETCVVGEITVTEQDAHKAVSILKLKMRKRDPADHFVREEKRRPLTIHRFQAYSTDFGEQGASCSLQNGVLRIAQDLSLTVERDLKRVKNVTINILSPEQHEGQVNCILDFFPVAVKVTGKTGQGVTNELTGMKVMLTAVEEEGFQPANIGSSEGILKEHVYFGRRGTPGEEEYLLHVDVLLAKGEGRTREGIMAAHAVCDRIISPLRELLKEQPVALAQSSETFWDIERRGAKRVLLIKLISGLGNMYDTALFPSEPSGFIGSRSIMDLSNNVQVVVTPNEYRDGVVHSLT